MALLRTPSSLPFLHSEGGRSRKAASGRPESPQLPPWLPAGLQRPPQNGGRGPEGRRAPPRAPPQNGSQPRRAERLRLAEPGTQPAPPPRVLSRQRRCASAAFGFGGGPALPALQQRAGRERSPVSGAGGRAAGCRGVPRGLRFRGGWGSGCALGFPAFGWKVGSVARGGVCS